MKPSVIWTYDMYKRVLEEYPFKGHALAKELGVSTAMLDEKATGLGVTYKNEFDEKEKEMLCRHGRKLKDAAIFLMPNRSYTEVQKALCALH